MLDEIEMLGPITAEGMEDHEPEAKKIHQEPTILSANRLRRDLNKLNKAVKDKRKGKEEPDRKKKMMKESKKKNGKRKWKEQGGEEGLWNLGPNCKMPKEIYNDGKNKTCTKVEKVFNYDKILESGIATNTEDMQQ